MPAGVKYRSMEIPGLVNASINIGVLETLKNEIAIHVMPRGADDFYVRQIEQQFKILATRFKGASVDIMQRSPAWAYNPDSPLLKTATKCYQEQFGTMPVVTAIHAGLECGILGKKIPGLDIIAYGANSYDVHTPDESLSIASTERVWKFLQLLLKEL